VTHHDAVCGEGRGGGTARARRRGGHANGRRGEAEESALAGRRGEDGSVGGRRVVEELHGEGLGARRRGVDGEREPGTRMVAASREWAEFSWWE
jgi:hypothetical protein